MAMKSGMRGAENEPERANPKVESKFDRSQGRGLKAPHLSHPGETAPMTGTAKAGYTENGHMHARDATPARGGHKVEHHGPEKLGSNMANGEHMAPEPNRMHTDTVGK